MSNDKGHYQVEEKKLPGDVEECWFYTGKQSSIHIVVKPIFVEVFCNGIKQKIEVNVPQINIDLPSIRKATS